MLCSASLGVLFEQERRPKMTQRSKAMFGAAMLLLAACNPQAQKAADVMSTGGAKDGGKAGTTVVYAETNCTHGNPDGVRCDEKTCKADSKSDCTDFAKGCVEYGNYYKGSNDAGTCTRVL
jgi:hypothetical protein